MIAKFFFFLGAAVGFLLGARAGRPRYEQIRETAEDVWENPNVQKTVADAQRFVNDNAPIVQERVATVAKDVSARLADTARLVAGNVTHTAEDVSGRLTGTARHFAGNVTHTAEDVRDRVVGTATDARTRVTETAEDFKQRSSDAGAKAVLSASERRDAALADLDDDLDDEPPR